MKDKFLNLFNQINRDTGNLLEHLVEIGYYTAPASSQYHGAKEAGTL